MNILTLYLILFYFSSGTQLPLLWAVFSFAYVFLGYVTQSF